MKEKIVISPSNTRAIAFLKSMKEKKAQLQKHFSQPGSKLPTMKVLFGHSK